MLLVPGLWLLVTGSWFLVAGIWQLVYWLLVAGSNYKRMLDTGFSILDNAIQKFGFSVIHRASNIEYQIATATRPLVSGDWGPVASYQ